MMKDKFLPILLILCSVCLQYSIAAQSSAKVKHRQYVLQNLEKYQKLGDFLVENVDTLIFQNLNFDVANIQDDLKKDYCEYRSYEDLLNHPIYLQNDFLEKTAKIDKEHLIIINVCLDNSIEFFVGDDYEFSKTSDEVITIFHILEYRAEGIDVPFKYPSLRDSVIHVNFNYGVVSVEGS